jgi:hypothetical protein
VIAVRALRTRLLALLFAGLSGADLWLTWRLLGRGRSALYEFNPAAAYVLGHFGWPGLTLFKLAAVLVVLAAAAALCRRRPRVGTGVLAFGCAVLAAVVAYSSLLAGPAALEDSGRAEEEAQRAWSRRLEAQIDLVRRHQALKAGLARQLAAGRCDLRAAVEQLAASDLDRDAERLRDLRRLYCLDSARDCWAAHFLHFALDAIANDPAQWRRCARDWIAAYRARYQVSDPPPWAGLVRRQEASP